MYIDGRKFTKMSDDEFTQKILASAKEGVAELARGFSFTMKMGMHLLQKHSEPTNAVERELIVKYYTIGDSVESLKGQVIVEISDCGGQPQFLEILPRFIKYIDFSIVVINLSQSFDDYPLNYFFNKEGVSVGEGVASPLTNEQVLRLHLQMIASLSQGDRKVKFAVVGTHKDLENTCIHGGKCKLEPSECNEPREVKNQRLKEMVEHFGLQDSVISKSHKEFIFAINAKTPGKEDHQTVNQLKDSILRECSPRTISIPVSYHALELTLKKAAQESGHIAVNESAFLNEVPNYHFTKESFKDALRYLHKKKRIFYFEREFPGRIIGEPQAVLNKQTELVVYNIQLSSNPEMLEELNRKQWRFVKYGFVTLDLLKEFPDHYVEGVFSPADMVKLFVKLLMVSEMKDGEYLMPCVLPTNSLSDCNPEPDTQSVPPMVLHFPGGPVRYGIFCGIICHLITKSKWELVMDPIAKDEPFHITRNGAHFSLPGYLGKVTINDPFDTFFVVTVHVSGDIPAYSETVSRLCIEVRDTIVDAITKVTEKLNYTPGTPKVAFLCMEHKDLHPATMAVTNDILLCTKFKNTKGGLMTAGHKVWLRGEHILSLWYNCLFLLLFFSDSSSKEQFTDLIPPRPIGPPSSSKYIATSHHCCLAVQKIDRTMALLYLLCASTCSSVHFLCCVFV